MEDNRFLLYENLNFVPEQTLFLKDYFFLNHIFGVVSFYHICTVLIILACLIFVKSFLLLVGHFLLLLDLITCSYAPNIPSGIFDESGNIQGASATLICIIPYVLFGNPEYTCATDGHWHGSASCSKFILWLL